jgi:hypothetical protein
LSAALILTHSASQNFISPLLYNGKETQQTPLLND